MIKSELQRYLDTQIAKLTQSWLGHVLLLGSLMFMLLGIMDYFSASRHFNTFIVYRLSISSLLIVFYILNRRTVNLRYQYSLILLGIALSAVVIELMILTLGGHRSFYYAGMNLLFIGVLGFIPINFTIALAGVVIVYSIYLFPILIFDTITDLPYFIASNAFLLATISVALVWRILSQKNILNELKLQYELAQEKNNLERLVQERTKELNKSEQWHRSLFGSATDGIIVLDRNGVIVNANDNACVMHGYSREDLLGAHITLLENDEQRENMAERMLRILAGESLVFETAHTRKDGSPLHLEISSKAIAIDHELYIQSFYRDITEKKKLQEHLSQSQKMESIGMLAGGIAHDFNNILTAIIGHTEVVRFDAALDSKSLRSLQVIEDVSLKANVMISKLLGFARKSSYRMLPFNINEVIIDTLKLLERMIDPKIKLKVALDERLPDIHGDINRLEQVMMNLIVNARDAMPEGGCLDIATHYRELANGVTDVPSYVPLGNYAQLTVTDTGTGMPDHVVQKIFEPFFTTKAQGKGTGLGLSMVYGAVKEHGGYILVQSREGRGSTFTIYLPVRHTSVSRAAKTKVVPLKGNEVILYVDDQEDTLSAVREILTKQGYKALTASDPSRALELFKEKQHEIALVITDMVMPELDGKELIRRLRAINPELKILAVSGHMNFIAGNEDIQEIAGFLQKPFESAKLLSAIRRILDTTPNAPAQVRA